MDLLIVTSHPIQYQAPIFRELAGCRTIMVCFAHSDTPEDQAAEDFGVPFKWDRDLTSGYPNLFLENRSRRPGFSRFFGCNTPQIVEMVRRRKPDAVLVMGWNLYSYWQAIVACKIYKVPILVRGDSRLGTPRTRVKRILKEVSHRALVKLFDRCLYVGKESKDYFRHYGVTQDKLFFSPHAVDNDWFWGHARYLDKRTIRREYGVGENARVILFVGKLVENKRPLDLLYAVRDIGENIEVVYAGAGAQQKEIIEQSRGIKVKIHMLGFRNQTEMPSLYRLADVLVLPSSSETWGLVVNEALACGIPAIVSDGAGCVPDLIQNGLTGLSYPVGNVRALQQAILDIVNNAGEIKYSNSARNRIGLYTPENASLGMVHALDSIKHEHGYDSAD